MTIRISDLSALPPAGLTKETCKQETKELAKQISAYQHRLYAESKRSLLVILQGMDAAGKDGSIRKVFNRCSPAGIGVKSFKKPTPEEFARDFLWRVHKEVPRQGYIKIFNRSHYEDVLIQRVHQWIDEDQVRSRMAAINAFEELLVSDGETTVLKFYLHLSRDRQREKLQERIDLPRKRWKHNPGDWDEHQRWDQYMACYEDVLNHSAIPWTVIPADKRWYRNYLVARTVADTLAGMNPQIPYTEPA